MRQLLTRRWWLLILIVGAAVWGSYAYSARQQRVYEAAATLFARPSPALTPASASLSQASLLSYGSVMATIAGLAQSDSALTHAAQEVGVEPQRMQVTAFVLTKATIVRISVHGPDPSSTIKMANRLSQDVAQQATDAFPTVLTTPLDAAGSTSLVQPKKARNLLLGGLAGVLVGLAVCALTLPLGRRLAIEKDARREGFPDASTEHEAAMSSLPDYAEEPPRIAAKSATNPHAD